MHSTTASTGTLPDDARGAAAYYLDRGCIPVPVPRTGNHKRPVIEGWQNLRPSPDDLDQLFPPTASLNLGLLLGEPSQGLIDIDLDADEAIAAGQLLLPATGWVSGRQSKPRSHFWYTVTDPPALAAQNYYDDVCPQESKRILELRSSGGHTIAPPGIHECGEPVVWHTFEQPAAVDLTALQTAVGEVAACALLARHWPGPGSHRRQDAYLHLAGGLARGGKTVEWSERFLGALAAVTRDEEARKRVQTVARTADKVEAGEKVSGWPKLAAALGEEVGKPIIDRVRQWLGIAGQQAEPWTEPVPLSEIPEAVPFPLGVFPVQLQRGVTEAAAALCCPQDYVAVPTLVLCGASIGASRALAVKHKYIQRAALYAAVIGPPGSAKTPAQELVTDSIHEMEEEIQTSWEERMEDYQREQDEYEAALKEWKKKPEGDKPEKPTRPVLQRLTVSDATAEALVPILKENPRGVVLIRDELIAWVQAMNQYREGGKGADQQFWLSAWSGTVVVVDRKKTHDLGPLRVRHPFISVLGGLTPDKLPTLRGDRPHQKVEQDGFIDRVLLSYPAEAPVAEENWLEVSEGTVQVLAAVFSRLRSLNMVPVQEGTAVKCWRPFLVKLTACGKAAWQRFTRIHADERNAEDFPQHLIGPWSKLRGYAARLALIVHFMRWACDEVQEEDVDGESMDRAARLVAYFKAHARRVYALMDADPKTAAARQLLQWITTAKKERFSRRDAYRALRGPLCRSVEAVDPILSLLEGHGYVRALPVEGGGRGRKPSPNYESHPLTLGQNGHIGQNSPSRFAGRAVGGNSVHSVHSVQGSKEKNSEDAGGQEGAEPTREGSEKPKPPPGQNGLIGQNCQTLAREQPPVDVELHREPEREPAVPSTLVTSQANLPSLIWALSDSDHVGLDLETTGLDPAKDRIRLLTLATECGTYIVDAFAVDVTPLFEHLVEKRIIAHNAAFDLAFLHRKGFTSGAVADTMLRSQLLAAGDRTLRHKLGDVVQRELGRALDKAEQKSDWAGTLTDEQLRYAALDAEVLLPLYAALDARIQEAGLQRVVEIEERALPAIVWMSRSGVAFDKEAWTRLAQTAGSMVADLAQQLDEAAPQRPGTLDGVPTWNWDSPDQVKEVLALTGCDVADTGDDTLAALDHPIAALLRKYREAQKRSTTYGQDWLKHVAWDGRVYPSWKQLGAVAGRMSCGDPNMQQLPRGKEYRRCVAAPTGRVLVKADYSQIELRIAAKVSGDQALLAAYQSGDDLHVRTARTVLGIADVTKEHRQLAKALNFGLLYGMGARTFQVYAKSNYCVTLTEGEAQRYRRAFFRAYPGLVAWHRSQTDKEIETRTLTGRRRLAVKRFTEKLNTPVQGTGADGLKLALALLWERRAEVPGAFPVLAVHDEIVMEGDTAQAEVVAAWLRRAMVDAMAPLIDPVPVEVDVKIASTWGG